MHEVALPDLRPTCDPNSFSFTTTAEVEPYVGLIGQSRAVQAIKFGLSIDSKGFNVCVSGEPGTGRTTAIREYLEAFAASKPTPEEWCYVNNFQEPHRPKALKLPPGKGRALREAMDTVLSEAKERIPRTFESEDFVTRRDEILNSVQRHREALFAQLAEQARGAGFLLQGNPAGFFLVPLRDDKPMDDQAFAELAPDERQRIMERREQLMEQLRGVLKQEQGFETAARERLAELERAIATMVIGALLDGVFDSFKDYPAVIQHLTEVRQDMIDNVGQFQPQQAQQALALPFGPPPDVGLHKYQVNLLVDRSHEEHAPVVFESNPSPGHLLGRIEKEAFFGALTTDFTMIRPGSLHRANGGYLVIDFDDFLANPYSWMELKRTLRTGQVTIEELGERLGFLETKTVRPEPIPWTGKVIMVAREDFYRQLYFLDPDFRELFKVKADFDLHIDRTPAHEQEYAGLVAAVTKREGLPPLDRSAVARVVDEGARLADDHNKLSIRFGDITDIVREAAYWARSEGSATVCLPHVDRAVRERIYRANLIEEHVREAVAKGIVVVDTSGEAVGQVNGLSVIELGDAAFGQPSRITASIGVGREGVIDLQREARLSGPIHTKAVLTLQGFLVDRYAFDRPLTLAARLSFEQSYGMVEGDSATCAETCALLSRISGLPLKQSFAITGSMDQKGVIQAIGGANYKIEGFYDVCRQRGLSGDQGVIIPASNVQHLMLREDVVQAVADGKFRICAISTVDEAMELLTGVPAGERDESGLYPPDSVNGLVMARLQQIAEHLRESGETWRPPETHEKKHQETEEEAAPGGKQS